MPVGPFFADFLCRECKLVVELDGFSHHLRLEADAHRDAWMAAEGYRVLRFTNQDVLTNAEGVFKAITETVQCLKKQS